MVDIASTIAAVCTAVGLTFCAGAPAQQAAAPPPPKPEVSVVTVASQDATIEINLPGRTAPHMIAEVRPQVSGIIQARHFEEGAEVKEGDLLYQIDPATYQAEYDSAQATLQKSLSTLENFKRAFERQQELARQNYASRAAQDEAEANLRQQEADIAVSRAAVSAAKINLDRTRITAPISGRIGRSLITQGGLVTANQADALATIQQLNPMYVDVAQSSADLLRLRRELKAGNVKQQDTVPLSLTLEDGTKYEQRGTLQFADVTVSPTTGSVILRGIVPNPDRMLLPGMYVRARLHQGTQNDAILVPQRAVSRDPKGNATAMTVSAEGKVEQRMLQVTRNIGDNWVVDQGLQPGDRVIVEGLQKVRVGQEVRAVPAAPAVADAAQATAPASSVSSKE